MTDTWWEVYNVASTGKGKVFVMAKQRRYDEQFKLQAARLVVEQGYSYEHAAKRLGTSSWSIRQWVKKYRKSGELMELMGTVGLLKKSGFRPPLS